MMPFLRHIASPLRRLGRAIPFLMAIPLHSFAQPAGMPPAYTTVTMPVYGQIVLFMAPTSYKVAFSKNSGGRTFIAEMIPRNETLEKWSGMVTVTGLNGEAAPLPPLRQRIESTYDGFRKACPTTFAAKPISEAQLNGHPAVLVYFSCGKLAKPGYENGHSESVVIAFVSGKRDIYTIQWAERAEAQERPIPFEDVKWQARLNLLRAARVCDIKPGEPAPYPSCIATR